MFCELLEDRSRCIHLLLVEQSDASVQLWYQSFWIELVSLLECIGSFLKPLLIHVRDAQIIPLCRAECLLSRRLPRWGT
jgi:hypothetical protein